jgi:uncharacterized protein (DUF433 family)
MLAVNRADKSLYEWVRKRHVRNTLDFGYLEDPKIGLPLVESIQWIVIRAEIFGQTVPANRAMEHPAQRHSIDDASVGAKTNDATRKLGGKLAIRGTRLAVSLILECLAAGMSLEDIDQSFDHAFPHDALPEVLKVASELADSFHVAP